MSVMWCIQSTFNLGGTGDSEPYLEALEGKLGRKFAGIRKNYGPDNSPILSPEITNALQHGRSRFIYQNGKPNVIKPDTDASGTFWRSGANGHYDAVFNAFFKAITASGHWSNANPFHYSPHHEQTSLSEAPAGRYAGTAADFKAYFMHVHALCVAGGFHVSKGGCIALCLVPDAAQLIHDPKYGIGGKPNTQTAPYQISLMDPGPQYYELPGGDLYQSPTSGTTPAQMFTALHNWAKAVGKPFFTGETGIASTKNPVAALAALDKALRSFGGGSGPGQCYAICWTSRVVTASGSGAVHAPYDYRMDASPAILAAYKKLADDPFYSA